MPRQAGHLGAAGLGDAQCRKSGSAIANDRNFEPGVYVLMEEMVPVIELDGLEVRFGSRTILTLVLIESMMLTLAGGLSGLLLAWLLAGGVGAAIKDYFSSFRIGASTFTVGLALMLAFGLITGAWPALTAMRLRIVDALRRV